MIRNLLFAVLLHLTNLLWAQPTGDFTIGFATQDTSLTQDSLHIYFYVPADYDGSTPYKLIIGNHGLGDPNNSMQIRDYLSSTGDSISAIVMCPDPYLRNQRRSKLVLNIALDSVTQWFNLDTNEYYIAGYSAGSDVAAQYVLDNPKHKMKGLIWYAPGFFYQPELSNKTGFPPTCLCVGNQDGVSTILGQVDAIRDSFEKTNFPFLFLEIDGVNHSLNTTDFPQIKARLLECIEFIDDPSKFVSLPTVLPYDFKLNIHPHPVERHSTLFYSLPVTGHVTISIMDITGREIQQLLSATQDAGNYNMALENNNGLIKAGTYLLHFYAEGQIVIQKFMVTR